MNQKPGGKIQSWNNARVAVIGLARSGVAACHFLHTRGARVLGADRRSGEELGGVAKELADAGILTDLGSHPDLAGFDAIILSPGVDPAQDFIVKAQRAGALILPELELGASEASGRIVCTTTSRPSRLVSRWCRSWQNAELLRTR